MQVKRSTACVLLSVSLLLAPQGVLGAGLSDDAVNLFKAGQYKSARTALEKAMKVKPKDADLAYYYGLTLHKLEDSAGAKKVFQKIVRDFPKSQAAIYASQALGTSKPTTAVSTSAAASWPFSIAPGLRLTYASPDRRSFCLVGNDSPENIGTIYYSELASKKWTVSKVNVVTGIVDLSAKKGDQQLRSRIMNDRPGTPSVMAVYIAPLSMDAGEVMSRMEKVRQSSAR